MPDSSQEKRALTAIMFTDMVGYTALMQKDENLARIRRKRHREVLEASHQKYNGEIIQFFGDGTLSIFSSSVEALKCGIEIQKNLKEPVEVPLRIGIHIGDIIIEKDGILGDAVNIASRIESFAVPGAILISSIIYEQAKSHSTFQFDFLGKFQFKNVEQPHDIYAVANPGLTVPDGSQLQGKGRRLDRAPLNFQSKSDNPNDVIIERVFHTLLNLLGEQSPEYAFYNSMKMAQMPIDNRMLANFLVQDFPWPIGVELRKLFSGDRRERDEKRIKQLLRVADRTVRFFLYCMISQLWDECKKKKVDYSEEFQNQIKRLRRLNFASSAQLIGLALDVFAQNQIEPFLKYNFADFRRAGLPEILDQIQEMKETDPEYISEENCQMLEEKITILLEEFSCLASFKLVAIKEIKVDRPRLKIAKFSHTIKMLNSQHEDFSAVEQVYDAFSDSHSVILLKSLTDTREYLNLSPLVIDTNAFMKDRKIPGVKNGVYLFSHIQEGRYFFIHSSAPESATFEDFPFYEVLEGQFADLQETFLID
jgi:class 3 adenylate cyclase